MVCLATIWVAGTVCGLGCSDKPSGLIGPIQRGDRLVLEFGSTTFEVNPAQGGRITSLKTNGTELLSDADSSNFGSTFWPSPQAAWNWPPPPEIDSLAYAATVAAPSITLTGGTDPLTHLSVTKRFTADVPHEAIDLEYTMTNHGTTEVSWAPWEITRVSPVGVTFWPTGAAPFKGAQALLGSQEIGGVTWVDVSSTAVEAKLMADGNGGWLAHVSGTAALLKKFQDQPATAAAPNEAEVEVYVNPTHSYVEVENQGGYGTIAAGASVTWKMTWYARQVPAGTDTAVGSVDLVAFAIQTLQ